ncbi:MAG: TonB family protein [Muribaculaceae bacterium]|nr:TonB family protein [Muribaculaceae bacterium]
MARGKQTCKILKEIRSQIAEANEIEFVTSECRFKGDCLGTCPKCEAEVRYLEEMLRAHKQKGNAIKLAGISAGLLTMIIPSTLSAQKPYIKKVHSEPTPYICDTITVKGIVVDNVGNEKGEILVEPLIGATVNNKATGIITATNLEGNFNIKACIGDTLEIGYVGYKTENIIVTKDMKDVSITLSPAEAIFGEIVEQQAEFPGGNKALLDFIKQNLKYPDSNGCVEGVEGRVIVRFKVDEEGNVCDPKVFKGLEPSFDEEALRVVKLFPKFSPGTRNGKPITTMMHVPIRWKLADHQKNIE